MKGRRPRTDAEAEARWQADYARLRENSPTRWGRWISSRLVFVPSWVARLYGGVFLWLGWVVVGRDFLDAPFYARQYILSHLWARVTHGHPLAAIGIFLCTGAMTLLVQLANSSLLSLVIGLGSLALLVWANLPRRELEADDGASAVIGRSGVRAGIMWSIKRRMDRLTPDNRRRLKRMGWTETEPPE